MSARHMGMSAICSATWPITGCAQWTSREPKSTSVKYSLDTTSGCTPDETHRRQDAATWAGTLRRYESRPSRNRSRAVTSRRRRSVGSTMTTTSRHWAAPSSSGRSRRDMSHYRTSTGRPTAVYQRTSEPPRSDGRWRYRVLDVHPVYLAEC
ncbi:hypothetical protein [Pseudonocardia sp.]|uniref:hypothetical protein n=1 Tax=Pseudonocardia sp. TaxID=60912 RepID=UPI003D09ADE0